MGRPTRIEFYPYGSTSQFMIAAVDSEAIPRAGEFVNIRGETWKVDRVTWALDQADKASERQMRANVEMTLQ